MHNYNVLLGRTARLAKLINRPGVIHAPLELNHPKSEPGLTLTAFHQPLSSVARDRLSRGRACGGAPAGPAPSRPGSVAGILREPAAGHACGGACVGAREGVRSAPGRVCERRILRRGSGSRCQRTL